MIFKFHLTFIVIFNIWIEEYNQFNLDNVNIEYQKSICGLAHVQLPFDQPTLYP